MNNFLDKIDRYKYGITAAVFTYLAIFVYVQLPSVEYQYEIKAYLLEADMEIPPEEIQLLPENIIVDLKVAKNIKNATRDENDTRKQSENNFTSQQDLRNVDKSVADLEKQFYEEAGGGKEREKIKQEMDQRKIDQAKNTAKNPTNQNTTGSNNAPPANVLASWNLKDRTNSKLPKPGYLCPQGTSGKVTVRIKVDQNGYVTDARIDPSLSSKLIGCMIENAEAYALKARFNISTTAPSIQEGTITYTYVP